MSIIQGGDVRAQDLVLVDQDLILGVEDTLVPDQHPNQVQLLQKAGFQVVVVEDMSKLREAHLNQGAGVLRKHQVLPGYMLGLQKEMRRELLCEV